tara:strand:- start:571 stop:1776 length:1206 start_codon:yes stop_codon:yes gene_type:complete
MKKKYSLYGLPEKIKFCSKCVMSNQKPNSIVEFRGGSLGNDKKRTGIFFLNNICSACNYSEKKKKIDWKKREKQLKELLSKFRKKNGYDVLVPSSGGKDSSYTAHVLKYKYNMNPLTVTWAPNMFTNIGWNNFNNLSNLGGIDNILYTPNGILHRKLTKLAFENLMHPFQPFIVGQKVIGPKIADKFNIPLIMYGENQAEYGNDIDDNKNSLMSNKFFSIENVNNIMLGGLKIKDITNQFNFKINEFEPYIPTPLENIKRKKIQVHYLGYFLRWDPQECFYYSAENTGFRPNTERTQGSYSKYSSIDDKVDWFHWYTTFIKFGYGRATTDASQEIRNNKITRKEGINLVRKYDSEFPSQYFRDFLDYTSLSEEKFFKIVDDHRSPHLWKFTKKKWRLKHQI